MRSMPFTRSILGHKHKTLRDKLLEIRHNDRYQHLCRIYAFCAFYTFYAFYAWWFHFPQSGALAEVHAMRDGPIVRSRGPSLEWLEFQMFVSIQVA
jgi:hypothetical protein